MSIDRVQNQRIPQLFIHHVASFVYNGGHWATVYGNAGPVISGIIGPKSSHFITEVIGPKRGVNMTE